MKITIIAVGKLKENYWQEAVAEYSKRLNKYVKLELIEVADEKAPENMSQAQEEIVKKKEGERILKNIKETAFIVTLEIKGKNLSSEQFSEFIGTNMINGNSHIVFIIGGSIGLSNEVLKQSNMPLSFSKMTFPHQLMRVVLLEQIYRAFKIMKKEPYHK